MGNAEGELAEVMLRHLSEIANGRCTITEGEIVEADDPRVQGILVGLLCLHEDLEFRQREWNRSTASLSLALAEAEETKRLAEERAALLDEAQTLAHLGGWDWDLGTNRITWSTEMYRIFGLQHSELGPTYEWVLERTPAEDRPSVEAAVERARQEGCPFGVEHRIVRPSGEVRIVLCRGRIILDEAGAPVRIVGTAQDVTDHRAMEARLRHGEKLAAIGQLAGGVAHELNNPLSVILGFAQGLERRVRESDPLRLPVTSIAREALRCKHLVQELLTFSRTAKKSMEAIELNELVKSTLVLLEARARTQDVRIVHELAETSPRVQANRTQLQQVIVNLGTNALDASECGGTITVRTQGNGHGDASLSITDSGCGIPEAVRKRIFEPFFTTKEVGQGTGLGLSLVYEIVRQHGGIIDVESEVDRGTTMVVRFPANGVAPSNAPRCDERGSG